MSNQDAQVRWENLLEAESEFFRARRRVIEVGDSLVSLIRRALQIPSERGTALRLLLVVDVTQRMSHFSELMQLASVGHADVDLCRKVIQSIPGYWVESNLKAEILPILEGGGSEEYRRLAELLTELNSQLLNDLVEMALSSDDEDINEVGHDFRRF
ncbi:MAG: hypothetical protein H0W08_24430 [Acidobacteria bacterium]|nr:hypothetical protein [Acidobacteriota bacterium]